MISFPAHFPRFGSGSKQPGKIPVRLEELPPDYLPSVEKGLTAFPEPARRYFQREGVVLVLSGLSRQDAHVSTAASPFVIGPLLDEDDPESRNEKQVRVSPFEGRLRLMTNEALRLEVIQAVANTLSSSNVDLLFDEAISTAFAADYEHVDRRLEMLLEGVSEADASKVHTLRREMARDGGNLDALQKAIGYCVAEHYTGHSELNRFLPGLIRPAESFFPQLYKALVPHLPSAYGNLMAENHRLEKILRDDEKDVVKNLLSDPIDPIHVDAELQEKYGALAARGLCLFMEEMTAEERQQHFYEPMKQMMLNTLAIWRKVVDSGAVLTEEEKLKLSSCSPRAAYIVKGLKEEMPKENRYESGEVADFFAALEREYERDPDKPVNVYEYVASVMGVFVGGPGSEGAEIALEELRMLEVRLEAGGDDLATRACQWLVETFATQNECQS